MPEILWPMPMGAAEEMNLKTIVIVVIIVMLGFVAWKTRQGVSQGYPRE